MIKKVKSTVLSFLPTSMARNYKRWSRNRIKSNWDNAGRPMPPPHQVKQVAIARFAELFSCRTLVETGTFMGDMLEAQKENFRQLFSIELSEPLWKQAKQRFKNDNHIKLLQGDSSKVLHDLVPTLDGPALFWLDGHYSGGITAKGATECPVFDEFDAIFKSKEKHVMLIDDARLFIGKDDYPTIDALKTFVAQRNPSYTVNIEDDIIQVFPK